METPNNTRLSLSDYAVGWVCVNESELTAARSLLDETHQRPQTPNDEYTYFVGRMEEHNIAIAKSNNPGTSAAATAATNMVRTFKNIRFVLMVGIAGGATSAPNLPGSRERTTPIFLGDVVVSAPHGGHGGILQYDRGQQTAGGHQIRSHLNKPGTLLMQATSTLREYHRSRQGNMQVYLQQATEKLCQKGLIEFESPGQDHDYLFASDYCHIETEEEEERCGRCDQGRLVKRTPRNTPYVHYGLIGTAESLMQDAKYRDKLRRLEKILCFEMEAAGLMDSFPCLAIRGISDYADSHKSDLWQPYAALAAAAYAKDLLGVIQPRVLAEAESAFPQFAELRDQVKRMYTGFEDGRRNGMLNKLTTLCFLPDQQKMIENRAPIGEWLTECEVFKRWAAGTNWQLRCYGEIGVGKTYLCAFVVRHLQKTYPTRPVIYMYLSDEHDRRKDQTRDNIMGSLVRQLLEFKQSPDLLLRLENVSQHQRPNEPTMKATFEELLQAYDRTYLIVDGIYQCSDDVQELLKDYTLGLIKRGFKLSLLTTTHGYRQIAKVIYCNRCGKTNLDMFINCQCHGRDYDLCFECKDKGASCPSNHTGQETYDTVRIQVRARQGEVAKFCHHRLTQASKSVFRQWDERVHPLPPFKRSGVGRYLSQNEGLIDSVAEMIAMKARGNFLIARAWIENLLSTEQMPRDYNKLLTNLDRMPIDVLNSYFVARMTNLKHYKSEKDLTLTYNTIVLVATACRPMNMLALQHALALMSDAGSITGEDLEDRVTILRATNGLITVDKADEADSFVHLFHGTMRVVPVGRYLQSPHSKMAILCMDYFAHEDYTNHAANLAEYPFLAYALEHWGDHVYEACVENEYCAENKAYGLLKATDKVSAIAQAAGDLSARTPALWLHQGVDALHLSAWFGLPELVGRLIRDGRHDINVPDRQYRRSPLRYACVRGHLKTVDELLRLGASPITTAITDAIHGLPDTERPDEEEERRVRIAEKILLKGSLTLNSGIYSQKTTILMHAVQNGYFNFVATLLETFSVNVNVPDSSGRTALWYAVSACRAPFIPCRTDLHDGVVQILLERNADPNIRWGNPERTVLAQAVSRRNGNLASIRALLECDRLHVSDFKELIHRANVEGNTEIEEMLRFAMVKKGISDSADAYGGLQSAVVLSEAQVKSILPGEVEGMMRDVGAALNTPGSVLPSLENGTIETGVSLKRDLLAVNGSEDGERKRVKVQ